MIDFARALPRLRKRVAKDIARARACRARRCSPAPCGCSTAASSGSAPRTTRRRTTPTASPRCGKRHVEVSGDQVTFDYEAKGGQRRVQSIGDPEVARDRAHAEEAPRRRRGAARLQGRRGAGSDVKSADINAYLKEATGGDFSAKDFRTWSGTVLAAVALAVAGMASTSKSCTHAREEPRGEGGLALPRQHAGGLPRVVHRPARVRPLRRRAHDRRCAPGARRRTRRRGPTSSEPSRRPCST